MRHHSNIQSLIPRCSSASLLPKAPAPLLVTRCFATSFLPKAEVTDRVNLFLNLLYFCSFISYCFLMEGSESSQEFSERGRL